MNTACFSRYISNNETWRHSTLIATKYLIWHRPTYFAIRWSENESCQNCIYIKFELRVKIFNEIGHCHAVYTAVEHNPFSLSIGHISCDFTKTRLILLAQKLGQDILNVMMAPRHLWRITYNLDSCSFCIATYVLIFCRLTCFRRTKYLVLSHIIDALLSYFDQVCFGFSTLQYVGIVSGLHTNQTILKIISQSWPIFMYICYLSSIYFCRCLTRRCEILLSVYTRYLWEKNMMSNVVWYKLSQYRHYWFSGVWCI